MTQSNQTITGGDAGKSIKKAQAASKNPNHDKHERVTTLPHDVFTRTNDMLKSHPPRVVAELLQEEGYHTDIQPITLCHILERYRREKIPADECINPYMVQKLTSRLKTNVNCFAEMSELITLQKERIRLARLEEIDGGKLNPQTDKQMHLMSRMLKIYGDMGIKAGLLGSFVTDFMRDVQKAEAEETFEIQGMFFRLLRSIGADDPEGFKAFLTGKALDDEQ